MDISDSDILRKEYLILINTIYSKILKGVKTKKTDDNAMYYDIYVQLRSRISIYEDEFSKVLNKNRQISMTRKHLLVTMHLLFLNENILKRRNRNQKKRKEHLLTRTLREKFNINKEDGLTSALAHTLFFQENKSITKQLNTISNTYSTKLFSYYPPTKRDKNNIDLYEPNIFSVSAIKINTTGPKVYRYTINHFDPNLVDIRNVVLLAVVADPRLCKKEILSNEIIQKNSKIFLFREKPILFQNSIDEDRIIIRIIKHNHILAYYFKISMKQENEVNNMHSLADVVFQEKTEAAVMKCGRLIDMPV